MTIEKNEVPSGVLSHFRRVAAWGWESISTLVEKGKRYRLSRAGKAKIKELNATLQQYGKRVDSLIQRRDSSCFSILIPAYRAESFIGETLDTILSQSLPEDVVLDVVVAVDGCDETRKALLVALGEMEEEKRKQVRMIFHKRNYGTYMMQNSLLYASKGDLVHIIGADDGLAPGALRTLWDFAERCGRCCSSGFILRPMSAICDAQMKPFPNREPHQQKGALVFTKSVLEKLGGFAPWMCAADSDFLRRAERKGIPFFSVPEVTYWYRHHGEQLTHGSATGMGSGIRKEYWRQTQARIMRGQVMEMPWIASDGELTEGETISGLEKSG